MYMTLPGNNPPLSTTDFVAFDQGEVNQVLYVKIIEALGIFFSSLLRAYNVPVPQCYHG